MKTLFNRGDVVKRIAYSNECRVILHDDGEGYYYVDYKPEDNSFLYKPTNAYGMKSNMQLKFNKIGKINDFDNFLKATNKIIKMHTEAFQEAKKQYSEFKVIYEK
jgi:hypothetical protein